MIYLASVNSSKIDEIKARFRAGGIPVFIVPDYSITEGTIGGIGTSFRNINDDPEWYRLNICLDDQLEEAKRLFEDSNYKVTAPVDVEKFEATMDKLGANRKVEWRMPEISLNWIVGIAILGIALLILRAAWTAFN